jgi:deoxyribonuclease-4
MGATRFGPAFLPSRERPEDAVESLVQRGYSACEIDFGGGFWMDWDYASRLGALAREADVALSIHAPLAAFVGHAERGKKLRMAFGMLDHTAGLARACGAAPIVFHPGFLLGRERGDAIAAVVDQLGELRERLAAKDRDVPLGVEVMGRVRELGSLEDVVAIAARAPWVRPVIDFAHLHAVTDGGYTEAGTFADALAAADAVMEAGLPFHIHFSDISYANRNEKSHLPYGEGTLRAEPLAGALACFERPATVISEAPDEESTRVVQAILRGQPAPPRVSSTPRLFDP